MCHFKAKTEASLKSILKKIEEMSKFYVVKYYFSFDCLGFIIHIFHLLINK